jgi:hypothetical protein
LGEAAKLNCFSGEIHDHSSRGLPILVYICGERPLRGETMLVDTGDPVTLKGYRACERSRKL